MPCLDARSAQRSHIACMLCPPKPSLFPAAHPSPACLHSRASQPGPPSPPVRLCRLPSLPAPPQWQQRHLSRALRLCTSSQSCRLVAPVMPHPLRCLSKAPLAVPLSPYLDQLLSKVYVSTQHLAVPHQQRAALHLPLGQQRGSLSSPYLPGCTLHGRAPSASCTKLAANTT